MTRLAIVHVGWPKTATTTLQHHVSVAWPNLAGRPFDRPGGAESKRLMKELLSGRADGPSIDGLFESSWHDRSLPVVASNEGLVGMRKWQHGRETYDSLAIPGYLAATTWPVHVVCTLRDPVALVRSNYRYAVRGGYTHSYAEFLEEERAELRNGRGPFSIRQVIEAWEQAFGTEAITVAWMETLVTDPASFWGDLAAATGVSELVRIGDAPLEHRNATNLGPLRWELAINRLLAPRGDRRRSPYTARVRRAYNRYVADHLAVDAPVDLGCTALERSVVEPMREDITWLVERYQLRYPG